MILNIYLNFKIKFIPYKLMSNDISLNEEEFMTSTQNLIDECNSP